MGELNWRTASPFTSPRKRFPVVLLPLCGGPPQLMTGTCFTPPSPGRGTARSSSQALQSSVYGGNDHEQIQRPGYVGTRLQAPSPNNVGNRRINLLDFLMFGAIKSNISMPQNGLSACAIKKRKRTKCRFLLTFPLIQLEDAYRRCRCGGDHLDDAV